MVEFNPYQVYTARFLKLLDGCRTKKNPALWLYQNNARVTLFMLESITRLMYKTFNDRKANKWRLTFKKLEDLLGQIDHYDVFVKEFSKNKAIGKEEINYLKKKREKAIKKLNKQLAQNDYYKKFMIRFSGASTQNFNSRSLIQKLEKNIKTELKECYSFYNEFKNGFNNLELQVHEFRRKLRWISIYAQSLEGIIVLRPAKQNYKWEKEFISREVKALPFNRLPARAGLKQYIPLNKTAFYALSSVINELGAIKDKGLSIEAVEKAIKKTRKENKTAHQMALQQLNYDVTTEDLLSRAHKLLRSFFAVNKIHLALTNIR